MKTYTLLAGALLLFVQSVTAADVTPASDIPDYWSSADGKSGEALWKAISAETNKNYRSIGYDGLYTAYKKTDVYPEDSVGKAGLLWDMYGECISWSSGKCGSYQDVCDCYNREHSIPQSWWGGGTGGIGNDIFHVVPTDGKINGVRSNYEYGIVNGGTNWEGNKFGNATSWSTDKKTIATQAGETVTGTGKVFEPKPQYKGDLARGLMGTIIKWQTSDLITGNNFFSGSYSASGYYGLTKKAVVLLMKWHREDPVSRKEIDRNNGIQQTQGNRNPFIDYPYLAEYIWGEHAGETVDMSKLMASCDDNFIPGQSDGSRENAEPVDPAELYEVTWMANGAVVRTDNVAKNKRPSSLPDAPESCSTESAQFMGWTDAAITGTSADAPASLYTKPAEVPAVTADLTLYAVYAKEEITEGAEPVSLTYSANTNIEGWLNTAANKGSYWLLDSGKELISPEIDLSGLQSIQARLRTYGGTQYDKFEVRAGGASIATITVSNGSTLTDYSWTNTRSLSGKSQLTFTAKESGTNKGVGFSSVTIDATGAGVTYSRYITSCQETTEVANIVTDTPAQKVLVGGELFILIGEQLFSVQGVRVR